MSGFTDDPLELRILEQTLHDWDIAVGVDGAQDIPADLCAQLLDARATIDRLRDLGYYGTASPGGGSHWTAALRTTGRLTPPTA